MYVEKTKMITRGLSLTKKKKQKTMHVFYTGGFSVKEDEEVKSVISYLKMVWITWARNNAFSIRL